MRLMVMVIFIRVCLDKFNEFLIQFVDFLVINVEPEFFFYQGVHCLITVP